MLLRLPLTILLLLIALCLCTSHAMAGDGEGLLRLGFVCTEFQIRQNARCGTCRPGPWDPLPCDVLREAGAIMPADHYSIRFKDETVRSDRTDEWHVKHLQVLDATVTYVYRSGYGHTWDTISESEFPEWLAEHSHTINRKSKDTTPPVIVVAHPGVRGLKVVPTAPRVWVAGTVTDETGVAAVTVDGTPVKLGPDGRFDTHVSVGAVERSIVIEASDDAGNTARKSITLAAVQPNPNPPATLPTLWVLSVGLSKYSNSDLDLQYADNDARSVADTLKKAQGRLFDEVKTKVLTNRKATRESILCAMNKFLGQAAQGDVIVIFLAGHGVLHSIDGTFFFLPHLADQTNLATQGLMVNTLDLKLAELRRNVDKVVLFIDTCHGGAFGSSYRAAETGDDLAARMEESEGLFMLAASKGGELSVEGRSFRLHGERKGHGAFTYALLKGLAGEADSDEDKTITVSELFAYVSKQVPRDTEGRQHPYQRFEGTDLPIFRLR